MNGKRMIRTMLLALLLSGLPSAEGSGVEMDETWSFSINAEMPGVRHRAVLTIAGDPEADDGYDRCDRFEPPAMPNRCVRLYCSHQTAEEGWRYQPEPTMGYSKEVGKGAPEESRIMNIIIRADRTAEVTLSWAGIVEPALQDYSVVLRDPIYGAAIDMKTTSTFCFMAFGGFPTTFRLEIARKAPIERQRWEKVFDLSGSWMAEAGYVGCGDVYLDGKGNELDLFLLVPDWRIVE